VNITSMLVRLQGALGSDSSVDQMLLLPGRAHGSSLGGVTQSEAESEINLLVGFNSSPQSLAALDLTLWIAYQTRMATRQQVTVQVVYVVDTPAVLPNLNHWVDRALTKDFSGKRSRRSVKSGTALAESLETKFRSDSSAAVSHQLEQFEEADRILWQARHLAEEWRGSLKTHLRFGGVAEELRIVAEAASASLLVLGCTSANHLLVKALGKEFPCPVLGIPTLSAET
jgi:nucleotide-binding universal stress UspA family protein